MARDNNIGTLRLLAALSVLFAHCFVLAAPGARDPVTSGVGDVLPLQRGLPGQGVALFFVISGYLVTQSFLRRSNLMDYAVARLLRIMPALWCALLVTVLIGAAITTLTPLDFLTERATAGYVVHNGSLLGMRYELAGVFTGNPASEVNVSLWTLPIEYALYGVVAALGVIGALRGRRVFNAIALGMVAVYLLKDGHLPVFSGQHDSELVLFFLAGAAFFVNRDSIALRGWAALPLALLAGLASALHAPLVDVAIIVAFAYAVLWIGFTERIRLPDLAARGDLSYGTYLYAALVTQLWIVAVGPESPWLLVALTTAVTLPLAGMSWHLVERPALAQKARTSAWASRLGVAIGSLRPRRGIA